MKSIFLSIGLLLTAALIAEEPASETDLKLEVSALHIVSNSILNDEVARVFHGAPGTRVALTVSAPAGGITQFDLDSSTIAKFIDDKGNDLKARSLAPLKKGEPLAHIGFGLHPHVSMDGKHCLFDISTPNLPAKNSTTLKLEGLVTLLCATQKAENVFKAVPLAPSKEKPIIVVAKMELFVADVKAGEPVTDAEGKKYAPEWPISLTLRTHQDVPELAEIKFFKADGSEIKSQRAFTSRMGIFGNLTVDWTYNLAEKVDTATLKVYVWSDLVKKRVPMNLTIGVGL